jgi:hypothetical protein
MSAIYAKDFASNLHDKSASGSIRHSWNAGGLRHVVKVLNGRMVAIELDTMTGYTQVGVKLAFVMDRHSGGEGIAVADPTRATSTNPHGMTVFAVRKVGVIIPLESGFGSDKYAAIDSERREREIARKLFADEMGELPAGTSEQTSHMHHVTASHRPTSFDAGKYQYRRYSLVRIQEASLCGSCLVDHDGQQHEYHCPVFAEWLASRTPAKA